MRLSGEPTPDATPPGVVDLVARIADGDDEAGRSRLTAKLAGQLSAALGTSAKAAGVGAVASGRWLTNLAVEVAPRIRVRDAATLSAHHGGLTGLDLAAALITTASRVTAAVGAGAGAVMSVEWAAPPTLLTAPGVIAAETLAQLAIEVKLVAELHEALGQAPQGPGTRRMLGYLAAWARQRGIDPIRTGLPAALTGAAKRELRTRLVRRFAKGSIGIAPVAGAAVGFLLNQRETRKLGEKVLADLARRPSAQRAS
ncbi:MAG: hypothetical protein QOJ92_1837 [Frankiales bacterium]|nr:hypothetical protein [Frankiales bacterium]